MRRLNLKALILYSFLVVPSAYAANVSIREHMARQACLSGDYEKGVEILSDLYLDTRDSTYLFNQGRCYEQNGRYEEAIARFREYMRKTPNLSPTYREDTEKHIAECENFLAAFLIRKPQPIASPKANEMISTPPPTNPQSSDFQKGLRTIGIAFGMTSLVSTGVGVYYYTQARSFTKKVNEAEIPSRADDKAGKNAVTMQWIFYSVGAATLLTGSVFYWLGLGNPTRSNMAGFIPMISLNNLGVMVEGNY